MATPQQIASQAGSANTAYQMQAARQSYGRKRKPTQVAQQLVQQENRVRKTELTGRARRKKGGNYTSYGQTGGALAPNALAADRAQVGNSHGVAIVRGDGVFGGSGITPGMLGEGPGARKPKLPGYLTELTTARQKVSSQPFSRRHKGNPQQHGNDGGIVSLGGRPGNKKRRPKKPSYLTGGNSGARYTTGDGRTNPKTGNRLYF